jgi:hypothetical protein
MNSQIRNTRATGIKKTLMLATAAVAFFVGMSVATAETLACRKCRDVMNACLASGTNPQTCYDNNEVCRVRSGCWVD